MNRITLSLLSGLLLISLTVKLYSQITYDMTVAKDGSGDYTTVQAAFNAVPKNSSQRTVIYIKNGTYKEKLVLESDRKNVTIIGQSRDNVKLTYDDYSGKVVNGETLGTSTSRSTYIKAEGFCALNITFENSSGPVGQALAIYIGGDKAVFYNCRFLGRQDTWYAGNSRQFVRKCYIEGTTDFMFGPSTTWFDSCEIYSYGGTAITAASTEQHITYGYVFRYCNISGASGVSTTLGRPWRPYAAVAFLNCSMTSCIKAAGWNNWGKTENESTARYSEYKNTGAGANTSGRVKWARQLTDAEAANYTISNVLKTTYANPPVVDNWDPLATLNLYLSGSTVKYSFTASVAEGQGTVTPSSGSYEKDQSVTVTATPAQGWLFDHWGGDLSGNTNPATVKMTSIKIVTAYFVKDTRTYYSITSQALPGGTITQTPEGSSLPEGTLVTLTAIPNNGWKFSGWSGDYTGTDAAYVISSLNKNNSVTASFLPLDKFVYQAEDGILNEAILETKNAGFTGSAYVNYNAAAGAFLEIPVFTDAAGTRNVIINYANGSGSSRSLSISVNGVSQIASLQFEATTNWETWVQKTVSLQLPQGASTVRLSTSNDQDGPNVDKITLDQGTSVSVPLPKDLNPVIRYYSSQKTLSIHVNSSSELNVSIFTLSGKKMLSRAFNKASGSQNIKLPLSGLRNGMYLIRLEYSERMETGVVSFM